MANTNALFATILNDDVAGSSKLSISSPGSVAEGNVGISFFTFEVTRTGDLSGAMSATYTVGGSAVTAADFGANSTTGTVTIGAGQSNNFIFIGVVGDTNYEADEPFTVTLSNPIGGTLATPSATV